MGRVTVTINHRAYRLDCGDGEEARIAALGSYVAAKVEELAAEIGGVGDERLIVMAALTIADELWDATGGLFSQAAGADAEANASDPEPLRKLKALASEIGSAAAAADGVPLLKRQTGR